MQCEHIMLYGEDALVKRLSNLLTEHADFEACLVKLINEKQQIHTTSESRQSEHVNYHDYIKSDAWQRVRREALKRDGYVCQQCGTGKNLEVHHINYEHLGQDGELNDVITLCRKCHVKVHEQDFDRRIRS